MDRTDESFPDVVAAIEKLPGDFLLDGEIVPYRDGACFLSRTFRSGWAERC
jgi:ATP-dependent DNA ligase